MELKLEVVLSSSIKRKKPWPRFCWLGQEKQSVFLLDDKRISEINLVSGRTKKRTPKLHPLLNNVVTMASSSNGVWLCGLLKTGQIFMWNRDKDVLKITTTVPEVADFTSSVQGSASRLSVQVSGDGLHVLLVAVTGQVFLWQCADVRDLIGVRDSTVKGNWSQIQASNDTMLPTSQDKEAYVHTLFVKTEALGDVCLSTFVFTSGNKLIISCLKIIWGENQEKIGPVNYSVKWATKTFLMSSLKPPCQPVKSRGALVSALSPDGQLLAVVLNQRQPQATQVLFVSTVNFVSVSRSLGGCGCKKMSIPSKYIRSYWVGCVSWSAGGLFLACVLKRGSLLMLARLGGLLTLSTSGCNIDFGPAHFLPLHPLVTYRPPSYAGKGEASLSSSSLSVRDVMRQRYSVTCHPQLFYFIVSDGYMATVVRVFDKISPALLLRALLNDTTTDLEKASQLLENPQKVWFNSVSALNVEKSLLDLGSTYRLKSTDVRTSADGSTLPFFLQDQGTMGNARDILETVQTFFDDDSDVDGVPPGSHVEEGGRLEFASMFDTLHALNTHYEQVLESDSEQGSSVGKKMSYCDLEKVETKLLSAWAFGLSLGNFGESKSSLLKHAMKCTVRFAALSQLRPSSMVHSESEADHTLNFLKKLFHFTPWDRANSEGPLFVGIMVELCRNLVQLVLTPYTEAYCHHNCEISSHNLLTALQIIQMFTQSLDQTYSLQQRCVWSDVKESSEEPELWPSDLHSVPVLQTETREETNLMHRTSPAVQPSRRLHGIWVWIYSITQKYMCELKHLKGYENWEREKQQVIVIMCQIQTVLQASGECLEEPNKLRDYSGEDLFLCGFYTESSEVWFSQLLETRKKSGKATVFQEKRLCLALLYSLLSQYHLKQAQELGDHMVCLILQTHKHQEDGSGDGISNKRDSFQCPWLSEDVSTDAAYAVVQTLGRFMASYFSNQPLYILPPHSVDVLPPVHLPHASSLGRLVPLCQAEVSRAVRQQQLSGVWTVEFAQDLLMLGALFPEAVWLAYHLGDWKAAVSLSQAYSCYCKQHFDFTGLNRRELFLPRDLQPANILQAELKCLLGDTGDSNEQTELDANHSVSDPVDEEDWGLLHVSIQDILKASVMAEVDAVSSPLSSLLDKAKDFCSCLSALVPTALYLPSPPLYCPQPSPNTQDPVGTVGYHTELSSRHKISEVIQKLLLVLRSANCCSPAAQWYLRQLRRARHILYKMKKKYSYPGAVQVEVSFPDGLLKFSNRSGCFRWRPKKNIDPGTIQTISCFRELCGLCWMLHVRDQLSLSCRKYQADRQKAGDEQSQEDSEVRSPCVDALQWAQRFLPFSRFLNCEEIVQDTILSLLSELPPVSLVADALVQSFPEEEESVRVPLREKYNTIMQTLKQCNVVGAGNETGEIMMVFIQDKLRLRKKHLNRLRRNLAPLELHLWEKEIEEEEDRTKQLSLGTSLSTSTLTDCGLLPVHSDADAADDTSTSGTKESKIRDRGDETKTSKKVKNVITGDGPSGGAKDEQRSSVKQPSLPSVGSWEFELEDAEYLNFLELFLSYLLEKEPSDSSNELPLLKDFSHKLREKELHSLAFDVLTSLHRRQRDGHRQERNKSETHIFRAGSCFRPETQGPAAMTSAQSVSQKQASSSGFPQRTAGRHKGLFNHQTQLCDVSQRSIKCSSVRSSPQTQTSESLRFCSVAPAVELIQGLDTELEAQFPELGRLLEWLMRWADRRLLLGQHGKNREKRRGQTADGVVIRVKASAPAVLTSLRLMQRRYTALFGMDRTHMQIAHTQWTVGPVLLPTHRKVEKEKRRVDTSSALTSDTASRVLELMSSAGSCVGETEELQRSHTEHAPDQPPPDAPSRSLSSHSPEAPAQEDGHVHCSVWDCSSISSEVCAPGASLKLSDLENPQTQSHSAVLQTKTSPHTESLTGSAEKEESVVHDSGSKLQSSSQSPDPHTERPLAAPPFAPPFAPPAAPPLVSHVPEAQTPEMRQRLGEDLYRLVQNINYMSLMEVLGASFSNLQLAQQNVSAQSNFNLSVNLPFLNNAMTPPSVPRPTEPPPSVPRPSEPLTGPSPPPEHRPQGPVCVHPGSRGLHTVNMNLQTPPFTHGPVLSGGPEMSPLSVEAGSPVRNSRNNLIPCTEGLLTTADLKQTVPQNPVLPPSTCSLQSHAAPLQSHAAPLQSHAAPLLSGLKLLQLHSPQFSAHVSRCRPQSPQNHPQTESGPSMFKHNDLMRFTRGHIRFTLEAQHQPVPVNSNQTRLKGREAPRLPLASPVWTESAPQRLKLLHVQPVSNSNITLPRLSPGPGPPSAQAAHTGPAPRIRLLQLEPQPKMMLPLQTSLSQISRLILGKKHSDSSQVHLLRAPAGGANTSSTLHNADKRQKRRERLEKAAREITFRPNDSIIPQRFHSFSIMSPNYGQMSHYLLPLFTVQTTCDFTNEDIVSEEAVAETGSAPSSGPLLRGEALLEQVFSTAAELQAFASTCKKPPERHDACTNTDSDHSLHVDKAVSTDVRTEAPVFKEEQTYNKYTAPDQQQGTEEIQAPHGRLFVRVVDLEDKSLHKDLPQCHIDRSSAAASAELHLLAAGVLRNGAEPQISHEPINETLQDQTSEPEINIEQFVPRSPVAWDVDGEDSAVESCEFESNVVRAVKSEPLVTPQSTVWFSSQMSHLDSQLTALQRIADSLETDLSKSRVLVNTEEKLTPVATSEKKTNTGVKKTVRLYAPCEMQTPPRDTSTELNVCGSFQLQTSASTNTVTPPERKQDSTELSELSNTGLTDETLEETGLSDTAEILEQLVREGFLSPTELDSSDYRSRLDLEQKGKMSKNSLTPQDEKRELRTWMRKKQRERLAVYQKHRQKLRENERRPFPSPHKTNCVTKNANLKSKWEPVRVLEHFNQRTLEAYNLATDLCASAPRTQGFSDPADTFTAGPSSAGPPSAGPPSAGPPSAPPFGSTYRVFNPSVRNKSPPENPRPRSAAIKDVLSDEYHKRLGLDRPVTSLPRDRLSQVTRRGMLTSPRSSRSNADDKRKSPSRAPAVERDHLNKTETLHRSRTYTERDVSHLEIPGLYFSQEEQDDIVAGEAQGDGPENLSDTGSNISQIDWAAIERMLGDEKTS